MTDPVFDYSKLRGKIVEKNGSQKAFAKLLGINECTLTSRMRGRSEFTQGEIYRSIGILDISPADVKNYFFTPMV
jgi:transcriptional regulator with XRE-family HTH domain